MCIKVLHNGFCYMKRKFALLGWIFLNFGRTKFLTHKIWIYDSNISMISVAIFWIYGSKTFIQDSKFCLIFLYKFSNVGDKIWCCVTVLPQLHGWFCNISIWAYKSRMKLQATYLCVCLHLLWKIIILLCAVIRP